MKTYSEFLTEAFDLVPQSTKEISKDAKGILTPASIKFAQKLFFIILSKSLATNFTD